MPINYIDATAARLAELLPGCDRDLLRLYTLLALTTGEATTLEHVHDAWATWRAVTRPDHESLTPFDQLTAEVQELDRPYADAIRKVAAARRRTRPEPVEVRRFHIVRDEKVVADGTVYDHDWVVEVPAEGHAGRRDLHLPSGWVMVQWRDAPRSTVFWTSVEDAVEVHGHPGTQFRWY